MKQFISGACTAFMICLILSACSGKKETVQIESGPLEMTAAGPLFDGSNMAQAVWEFDLNALLNENSEEKIKITSARITKIAVVLPEAEDLPELEKMVLEMTSKSAPMTRVGLYEGKIVPGTPFELSLADKQEKLGMAFADNKITFVGDFDMLAEEYWEDIVFSLQASFEITYVKK